MNIILLSGGSGKRLWPLSNDIRSKQFIKIFKTADGYESMVQRVYRQIKEVDADASVPAADPRGRSQIGAQRTVLNNVCAHFSTPEAHMEYALITAMSPFAMM